jgi:methanogenic corrinoid protein MtbC1
MSTFQEHYQITESIYENYLKSLLNGNRSQCTQIVNRLLENNIDIKILYTNLFQKSMYRVGELWEFNRISVATEHLATSITESLMNLIYPKIFSAEHIDKTAVISCSINEYHQVGARMVADIFELNGWNGYFLGANTPVGDLTKLVAEKKPRFLGLSISIYFNMTQLIATIENLRGCFSGLDILVGGQAFRWGGHEWIKNYPNVLFVPSLTDLENLIAAS